MRKCPNCDKPTKRTEDWACQWCGYPLTSGAYKKIQKTYKQIKEEEMLGLESRPVAEPEPEPVPEFESKQVVESELEAVTGLEAKTVPEPEPESVPELESKPVAEPEPESVPEYI